MSTLFNVNTRRDEAKSPSDKPLSVTTLTGNTTTSGVSVRYAPKEGNKWWVIRATYGREEKVYNYIINDGTDSDAYYAMHFVRKKIGKSIRRIHKSLLPSLLFVYCSENQIKSYVHDTPQLSFIRYYYDHTESNAGGINPPLTIPYPVMLNFIRATSVDDDHIMLVDPQYVHYQSGDEVIVTQGKFVGVKGRVARAAGQQRVIVALEGIALIATAYIPTAWLDKV